MKILTCLLSILLGFNYCHAMTTLDSQILDEKGEVIELKGINWFGFNNQQTMVDGIWGGPNPLSYDFATVVHRMKLLGFNAIRLPFSFKDLFDLPARDFTQIAISPSLDEIQKSVEHPHYLTDKRIVPLDATPERIDGLCNEYLPNGSTLERFLYVAHFFAENGFYVLIDNHLREDQTALKNPQEWLDSYVALVTELSKDPVVKSKLMIDILNEPDNFGLNWKEIGPLYLSTMDVLYPINPEALFFIEGAGQSGLGANWGDGFATDAALISQYGLSDPNPFFQELLKKPYLNQIVISPHIYPPSVTHAQSDTKEALKKRMHHSFQYLSSEGYQYLDQIKIFPIAIGEFGSTFTESPDLEWLADFLTYSSSPSWFFWCWNANSGDTGGIVADNWVDIQWNKIDYLTEMGLRPWYLKN